MPKIDINHIDDLDCSPTFIKIRRKSKEEDGVSKKKSLRDHKKDFSEDPELYEGITSNGDKKR